MSDIETLRQLAGIEPAKAREPEVPQVAIPSEIRNSLQNAIKRVGDEAQVKTDAGDEFLAQSLLTSAGFMNELCTMLDGTEDGYKRAQQHVTAAANYIQSQVPCDVMRFLLNGQQPVLNADPINKEGIRRHLRDFVKQVKEER